MTVEQWDRVGWATMGVFALVCLVTQPFFFTAFCFFGFFALLGWAMRDPTR